MEKTGKSTDEEDTNKKSIYEEVLWLIYRKAVTVK